MQIVIVVGPDSDGINCGFEVNTAGSGETHHIAGHVKSGRIHGSTKNQINPGDGSGRNSAGRLADNARVLHVARQIEGFSNGGSIAASISKGSAHAAAGKGGPYFKKVGTVIERHIGLDD